MYLRFTNQTFHDGINLTVRRGVKWNAQDGESVIIVNSVYDPLRIVEIETRAMRFCDLQDADLVNEHDAQCRTVAGLLAKMREFYPDFDEREIVTLVFFEVEQ